MMIVKDMLEAIEKEPTKEVAEKYLADCLYNASVLALKNAPQFDTLERCITDATRQFQVLKDCINEDDKLLFAFTIDIEPIEALKEIFPKAYDSIKQQIATAINK